MEKPRHRKAFHSTLLSIGVAGDAFLCQIDACEVFHRSVIAEDVQDNDVPRLPLLKQKLST
eukprot:2396401-Amphidinium_carterae.1